LLPERPQDHKIDLEPGAQPTARTQWRLTQPELTELRSQLACLLEKGFIRPSTSPFAAPILLTQKKKRRATNVLYCYRISTTDSNQSRTSPGRCRQLSGNYPVHDKEMLAIVHTFKVWRCLPDGSRRDSTDRPQIPTVPPRAAEPQPTTNSLAGFPREQLPLHHHVQTWGEYHRRRTDTTVRPPRLRSPSFLPLRPLDNGPAGLLQLLERTQKLWQHVTMDFVTGLLAGTSGNDAVIVVVVDRLTKVVHFALCRTTITAKEIAKLFISTVVRLHGPTIGGSSATVTPSSRPSYGKKPGNSTAHVCSSRPPTTRKPTVKPSPPTRPWRSRYSPTAPTLLGGRLPILEFSYNNAPSTRLITRPSSSTTGWIPPFPR
ncbi:hypothetical protein CLOM_g149, partial [Closterium sp. NIES-68]